MAAIDFLPALKRVLVYEGGYSNHPEDPGGVTLEGIIQRVYDGYRTRKGFPTRPLTPQMRNRPDWVSERNDIYRLQYWNAVHGDEMPPGVDLVVFDGAVNSGPAQSIKWLQRALRLDAVDGVCGQATIAAVMSHHDHDALIADICARRMAFLQQLKTFRTFGEGWSKRVANVKAAGQALATGSVGPAPIMAHEDGGNAKAHASDIAEAPVSVGQSATGATAGTVSYGALDQLQNVSSTIAPIADTIIIIKYVVLAITLITAGVMLYGIYRSMKAQRARNGEDVAAVPENGT